MTHLKSILLWKMLHTHTHTLRNNRRWIAWSKVNEKLVVRHHSSSRPYAHLHPPLCAIHLSHVVLKQYRREFALSQCIKLSASIPDLFYIRVLFVVCTRFFMSDMKVAQLTWMSVGYGFDSSSIVVLSMPSSSIRNQNVNERRREKRSTTKPIHNTPSHSAEKSIGRASFDWSYRNEEAYPLTLSHPYVHCIARNRKIVSFSAESLGLRLTPFSWSASFYR